MKIRSTKTVQKVKSQDTKVNQEQSEPVVVITSLEAECTYQLASHIDYGKIDFTQIYDNALEVYLGYLPTFYDGLMLKVMSEIIDAKIKELFSASGEKRIELAKNLPDQIDSLLEKYKECYLTSIFRFYGIHSLLYPPQDADGAEESVTEINRLVSEKFQQNMSKLTFHLISLLPAELLTDLVSEAAKSK